MSGRRGPYDQIIEYIFFRHFESGLHDFVFERDEIEVAASALELPRPRNLGDVVYTYRFRRGLPPAVMSEASEGKSWIIRLAGSGRYRFVAATLTNIVPTSGLVETKIPDATPGVIASYALGDEQALLAKLRYNRLIDIFTGVIRNPMVSYLL